MSLVLSQAGAASAAESYVLAYRHGHEPAKEWVCRLHLLLWSEYATEAKELLRQRAGWSNAELDAAFASSAWYRGVPALTIR